MSTQIQVWHSANAITDRAMAAVSAARIKDSQTVYETEMELFEAVRELTRHCRTVGIFSNKEGTDRWIAITSYRNFNQR